MKDVLKIFALGGLGEFGKNFLVVCQGQDAIILDCGAQFSDGRNPGLDIIIPDFTPALDESLIIHGLLLTHAHEDHIGSVPYFLHKRNVPVYGSKFTQALVSHKCREFFHRIKLTYEVIDEHQAFDVGPFHITPVAMAHSIPEALAFFVDTKLGTLFHTGDFKIDPGPADGRFTDLEKIATVASEKKMLLLTSDSTNVLVPGHSRAETSIIEGLQKAFEQTKGKLVITSFSSHIPRIYQVCQLAHKNNRKVLLMGRSILQNVETAKQLGHMNVPEKIFVDEEQASKLPPHELLIIATGTQAEPRAALSKMVFGQIKGITLGEGDLVVYSSRAIPGHERSIYHMINHIYRLGAQAWTWEDERVHVSGHGYKEDLATIIKTIRPKYMVPVHGELKMLKEHQKLAISCGVKSQNTFFMENGDVLEIDHEGANITHRLELSPKLVDQGMLVDLAATYLKDRKKISTQGTIIIVLTVDKDGLELLHDPVVIEYGFIEEGHSKELIEEIQDQVERELFKLSKKPFHGDLDQQVRMWVSRTCRNVINRKPVIVPIIIDA
ncbi:MAG: ribonuclease J [Bdellovibrionales bacterium]|nr:ribonuclease J [Bdellovibrionales bacterium]